MLYSLHKLDEPIKKRMYLNNKRHTIQSIDNQIMSHPIIHYKYKTNPHNLHPNHQIIYLSIDCLLRRDEKIQHV